MKHVFSIPFKYPNQQIHFTHVVLHSFLSLYFTDVHVC